MTVATSRVEQLRAALKERYAIDRPVGEGGMAVVWLAHDLKHDRRVAVKILRRELSLSIGAERFAREIAIAAKLNHPNIVGVLDSGVIEVGGTQLPYYVMPLVEGPSLRDLLERDGPMSVDEAIRYCAEVADALDFAHARGVVHRDVKPGNILLQAGHAVVADFGIARAIDAAGGGPSAMTTESVVGTPVYMSPEQCRGDGQVDGRSDIYSLGCVLYEMLGGAPPFEANTPQAVSVAHCSLPVPPLVERRPGLPVSVQKVVAKALEKSPAARFATAGELRRELERVRTRTSAPTETFARVEARRRSPWLVAAAAALLLVAGAGSLLLSRRARPPVAAVESAVLVIGGFRDRSGTLGEAGARLADQLRQELQQVPALKVVDVSDQPELPTDSLQRRYGADWIVKGVLDRAGDSVGFVVRMVDAHAGRELGGTDLWRRDPTALVRDAALLSRTSPFGVVRTTLGAQLRDRRLTRLERDTNVLVLRGRAQEMMHSAETAYYELGPTRGLAQLMVADSLLADAQRIEPASILVPIERARLAEAMAIFAAAGRQRFPDSTGIEPPAGFFRAGISFAEQVIALAPALADGWLLRAGLTERLLGFEVDSALIPRVLSDLRQANRLDPTRPQVWLDQSSIELRVGDLRAALYSVRRAEDADVLHALGPMAPYRRFELELDMERFDSALAVCRRGREQYPDSPVFRICESQLAGRRSAVPTDAGRALQLADSLDRMELVELPPGIPTELRLHAAAILWRAGLADSGERVYSRLAQTWGPNVDATVFLDAAYARMIRGDADSALALAARAVRGRQTTATSFMTQPRYAPLRREPGFADAMQGIPPGEARHR